MKIKGLFLVVLAVILVMTGCESMGPKAKTGALAGGGLGAVAGGVIGHQMGSGIAGAAIGATIGAIGGGLLGGSWDDADKKAAAENPSHLSITAIIDMVNKGTPDAVIIDEIKRTKSVYNLNSEAIDHLKKNKVSDKVIDAMLAASAK